MKNSPSNSPLKGARPKKDHPEFDDLTDAAESGDDYGVSLVLHLIELGMIFFGHASGDVAVNHQSRPQRWSFVIFRSGK